MSCRESLTELATTFCHGVPGNPCGDYRGEILETGRGLLSDPFFDWVLRVHSTWMRMRFDRQKMAGCNLFQSAMVWGGQGGDSNGLVQAFEFTSRLAPSIADPGLCVLRLDYCLPSNSRPTRRIIEEIVELAADHYLGRMLMTGLREVRLVHYFQLYR